jgi:hypothetical protein
LVLEELLLEQAQRLGSSQDLQMSSGMPSVTPMNHSCFDAEPRICELAYVAAVTLPLHRLTFLVACELKHEGEIMPTFTELLGYLHLPLFVRKIFSRTLNWSMTSSPLLIW